MFWKRAACLVNINIAQSKRVAWVAVSTAESYVWLTASPVVSLALHKSLLTTRTTITAGTAETAIIYYLIKSIVFLVIAVVVVKARLPQS